MYAIIETGGKQYKVSEGDVITVEKLKAENGDGVTFDKVLIFSDGNTVEAGTPYLNMTVTGKIVESGKGEKVIVYKYKSKKNYRKKQGHRQPYTLVEITSLKGKLALKKEAAETAEEKCELPNFKGMKKAEIIEFAKANNIEIDEKSTIAVLCETIAEAMN